MMEDREMLVELLGNIYLPTMAGSDTIGEYRIPHKFKKEIADHLIANGVVIQKQGEWCHFHTSIGTAICSNCHRLDHIDPLASYCRYCGAKMKEVK